jgi:ATP-dependent DNA helicase RecG
MRTVSKLPINLADLLRQRTVEGDRIEYKAGWNPESVLHSLCAFANDFHNLGGGYIIIGVEERNGRPVLPPKGIDPDSLDAIQKEILNLGHHALQPNYHPLSTSYEVEGKSVLILWVPGGETRPYRTKVSLSKEAKEWAYYIRKQSSTVRAKGEDERELLGLAATVPFDDRYNQSASLDDFSPRLIEDFLREVGSDLAQDVGNLPMEALGRQMNIVGGPSEAPFPKNVGLLFFNETPRRFFPATQIDVVWFPEGAGGDRFEEKIFQGPLARMTREALDYIQRNHLKETVVKHPDRAEAERFWNFPYAAIEEAVVNAVYHRSYQEREPVEVRISPDDLVVLSFPGPDRSIRMEDLRAGKAVSRRYRNRRIGEFLKELDLTEGRSTGIPKILKVMKENGSPTPEFESDDDRTSFLIRLPVHARTAGPSAVETTQVGTKSAPSPDQAMILKKCRKTAALLDLMAITGRTDRTKFRHQVLNPLIEAGLIEMTIPDKHQSSKQKYRLTAAGSALLEQHAGGQDGADV